MLKMMTLEKLLERNELPVKVIRPGYGSGYSEIFFKTAGAKYIGLSKDGLEVNIDAEFEAKWSIYTPPKKTVQKWLWAQGLASDSNVWIPSQHFYSEEEWRRL